MAQEALAARLKEINMTSSQSAMYNSVLEVGVSVLVRACVSMQAH